MKTFNLVVFNLSIFLCLIFFNISQAQQWRIELEKNESKTVREIIVEVEKYYDKAGRTKENKYKHWLRWKDYAEMHQNSEGYLFNHSQKNAQLLKKMEKQIKSQPQASSRHFHGEWESVNPNNFVVVGSDAPHMGRVNCIAKPPSNSNIIYAGAATGGVWKSYNHGATWTPLWDGMVQMGVSSIVIDYTNENHILVLTGDADSKFIPCSGIVESFDGGATWKVLYKIPTSNKVYGYKMIQSLSNSNTYYAVFSGFGSSITPNDRNIKRIQTNFTPASVLNEYVDGAFFDLEYYQGSDTILFAAGEEGLYFKPNNALFNELPASSGLPSQDAERSNIAIAPSDPNTIYYLFKEKDDNTYGLYRSSNGGGLFTLKVDENNPDNLPLVEQASYDFTLKVDQSDRDKVYIGTAGYYRSDNAGTNWVLDWQNLHADIHNIYMMDGNHYVCTDGGLSYRPIGTNDFISINNGLLITQFYDIDKNGNRIVGGTQDNGTMFWEEGGSLGVRKLSQDGLDCMYHPTNNDIVFASTQSSKHRSTNNGDANTTLFGGNWNSPMAFWPNEPTKVIICSNNALRVSYNTGVTWPDNITDPLFNFGETRSMSQCESNTSVIYMCSEDQVVKSENFSTPSSASWDDITTGLPDTAFFRSIQVHPGNSEEVIISASGYMQNQIFKSTNGGDTWSQWSAGISNLPVYCIYYDHVNGNGYYAGTELGVFYRSNSMSKWIPFSTYYHEFQFMI